MRGLQRVSVISVIMITSCVAHMAQSPAKRFVRRNVLISTEFPSVKIRVDRAFHYLGQFSFTVPNMAAGERYIFADLQGRKVKRLFIAQFESILPDSAETYNYSFNDATTIGSLKFRPNTFAFNNQNSPKKDPPDEGTLTTQFLLKKGYQLESEIMAARLVTVPDAERKHELILFYMENVADKGHSLHEFYAGEERTPLWQNLSTQLGERLMKSFTIIE